MLKIGALVKQATKQSESEVVLAPNRGDEMPDESREVSDFYSTDHVPNTVENLEITPPRKCEEA